jgi:hydrogenase nickel incorporation protein HypA/HybF
MSIAQSVISLAAEEAGRAGLERVAQVRLKIGRMSGVVPDSLAFCWELMTSDGPIKGAELVMEEVPVRALCRECGESFEVEDFIFICPSCDSQQTEIIAGRELTLSAIAGE